MGARSCPERYVCDECRLDNGWHYDADGNASRCPNRAMTEQVEQAQELAKLAHENAWAAAQQIMRDVAATMPRFDANLIRDRFEAAGSGQTGGIPTSLIGSAFTWAAKQGLIVKDAERVMSDQATTRHEIATWRSLAYRKASA